MFLTYQNEQVMTSDGNVYLLQYASFINKEVMEENIKELSDYFIYEEDGKYYVFLGCYTNLENAQKVSSILENKNIYTYIKNDYLGNSEIIEKIETIEKDLQEKNNSEILEKNKEIINIIRNL